MNEVEKMRSSQLADMSVPEIQVKFEHAKRLLAKMRVMSTYDEDYRSLLEELVPGIPATSIICPPFHCDHGDGIRLGEHVFVNANCTFLDGGYITIGAHTLVGPCVQIYTPHHPMDYIERRTEKEYAYPVTIGEDCWIGGGAILRPGVRLAQLVQSICLTSRGSAVRIRQRPHKIQALSFIKRAFSSAGSEHLPYKQRVGGSNPSTPTGNFHSKVVLQVIVRPFFYPLTSFS